MKRFFTTIIPLVLVGVSMFAQAPEKFTYQAVVRNATNNLVINSPVGVRVSILQGGVNGTLVYMETQSAVTNANGLITLQIGGGNVQQGNFADIEWAGGFYFLKTETDPNGGNDYSITSTQQLLSVPYALYAKEAANGFSGDYNDLTNTPQIPTVPTNVSAFTNDAGYITAAEVPVQVNADWNATSGAAQILNKPTLFSGNYNDLTNKPTIPTVPTNVSAFTNDAGYLTSFTEQQVLSISHDTLFLTGGSFVKLPAGFDGNYNSLTNKPTIPTVPTNVSAFTNDAGYITAANVQEVANIPTNVSAFNNDAGYLTTYTETDPQFNAWDKDYNDLTNKPTIPTIPTNVSAFTNDAGYITAANVQEAANIPTNVSAFNNDAGYLTSYTETDPQFNAWDKDYNDLTNKPTLFDGNYNSLTNKPNLATVATTGNYTDLTNKPILFDGDYNSLTNKPNLSTVATTGNYNDLVNKPTLFSGNYNDLTNKPTIPTVNNATLTIQKNGSNVGTFTANQNTNQTVNITVPTMTSQLTNNSGFITNEALPTNVSQLNNDAGYITAEQCGNVDLCALADLVNALQQQVADLQAQLDSVGLIVDTAITHIGFHCGISTVTDHEGNVYATVQIGDQCWMRDNLRTTTSPSTGTYLIPAANANYTYTGKQARWYKNDSATYAPMNYGLLYNWNAAVDTFNTSYGETSVNTSSGNAVSVTFSGHRRDICPVGWHLPSDAEWTQLTDYVSSQSEYTCGGNSSFIAKALASAERWNTHTDNCAVGNDPSLNNATGFSAVPAGFCDGSSSFYGAGYSAGYGVGFWSSTQDGSNLAWSRFLDCDYAGMGRDTSIKYGGFSVRCLRDSGGGDGSSATLPTVITNTVSNITPTTATSGGNIIADGGASVTARGICWSTSQNPTVSDNNTTNGGGTGSFTSNITGLTANTTYYVRAYATNSVGTAYGETVAFTTISAGGTAIIDAKSCPEAQTVTDHEGNVYATVQIGDQCWMRDNLRTTTSPSTGTYLIPAAGAGQTLTGKQARWYNNDSATYAPMNYGLLYNWNAAVDTFNTAYGETSMNSNSSNAVSVTFSGHRRGICPVGWHLPSDAEWTQLTDYVSSQSEYTCGGNSSFIAKALASAEGWNTHTDNCVVGNNSSLNNATGFSAVPAGFCDGSLFAYAGAYANFWSSTQRSSSYAWYRSLYYYYYAGVSSTIYDKDYGFSVRCLRDSSGGDGSSATLPTVITNTVSNITPTTATSGGNIIADGGASVTARGICWSTSQNPTVSDNHTTNGSGTGSFTSNITGLTANTTYYVRAYATNSVGTAYGNEVSFTTLSTAVIYAKSCPAALTVTDHEGNVYATVQIGDQCWMRDNLRTTTSPSTGTYLIPAANANYTYTGKQARWYNNDSATYAPMNYGLLYNWNAAVDTFNAAYGETSVNPHSNNSLSVTFSGYRRGICPVGWHLPSDAEWTQLTDYVSSQSEYTCGGNSSFIVKALASAEGWNTHTDNCAVGNDPSLNNATGFSAVPAGSCLGSSFNDAGGTASFWSSAQYGRYYAWGRALGYSNAGMGRDTSIKYGGFSVRCLRD